VLEAEELPARVTSLHARLAKVDQNDFTHLWNVERAGRAGREKEIRC
jgi:hypothetical protein